MKVAVKKDGHRFYTHVNQVVVDPAKSPQNKDTNGRKEEFKGKDADHTLCPEGLFCIFKGFFLSIL